ncbi:MAG: hypothetical protein ABA06_03715 [Parcubacteria bacterium C7867-001]|nr:MAG: hypothetical protein ABA06_03715 [Parcubacteria bacterium C7867-001]
MKATKELALAGSIILAALILAGVYAFVRDDTFRSVFDQPQPVVQSATSSPVVENESESVSSGVSFKPYTGPPNPRDAVAWQLSQTREGEWSSVLLDIRPFSNHRLRFIVHNFNAEVGKLDSSLVKFDPLTGDVYYNYISGYTTPLLRLYWRSANHTLEDDLFGIAMREDDPVSAERHNNNFRGTCKLMSEQSNYVDYYFFVPNETYPTADCFTPNYALVGPFVVAHYTYSDRVGVIAGSILLED